MIAKLSTVYEPLPQASTFAPGVEQVYSFIFYFCLISFILSMIAMVYFIRRYRRSQSKPETTPYIHGNNLVEGSVIGILFVAVMIMFYWGWIHYKEMRKVPADAIEINVTARQWAWDFEYTNGRKSDGKRTENVNGRNLAVPEIVVPRGKPVKLIMTAKDVLHSFFIPDFRVKQDVVPGTYTYLWFNANQVSTTGSHIVYCTEYCGMDHSMMMARIKVVEPEEYDRWQKQWEWETRLGKPITQLESISVAPTSQPASDSAPVVKTGVERGQKLFNDKSCSACHTINGQPSVGPTLKGIFGTQVELEAGGPVAADENYIRESITEPGLKIVKGYQPQMPVYKGTLKDDELTDLIAYIKSLSN